jgi:hypothetical protein
MVTKFSLRLTPTVYYVLATYRRASILASADYFYVPHFLVTGSIWLGKAWRMHLGMGLNMIRLLCNIINSIQPDNFGSMVILSRLHVIGYLI